MFFWIWNSKAVAFHSVDFANVLWFYMSSNVSGPLNHINFRWNGFRWINITHFCMTTENWQESEVVVSLEKYIPIWFHSSSNKKNYLKITNGTFLRVHKFDIYLLTPPRFVLKSIIVCLEMKKGNFSGPSHSYSIISV